MADADSERLLAEALRAQAAHRPAAGGADFGVGSDGGFGAGSGAGFGAGFGAVSGRPGQLGRADRTGMSAGWLLLIALVLGLLTGAVAGLVTVL